MYFVFLKKGCKLSCQMSNCIKNQSFITCILSVVKLQYSQETRCKFHMGIHDIFCDHNKINIFRGCWQFCSGNGQVKTCPYNILQRLKVKSLFECYHIIQQLVGHLISAAVWVGRIGRGDDRLAGPCMVGGWCCGRSL